MENKNLSKAIQIVSRLIAGQEVSAKDNESAGLYEDYVSNGEVYDLTAEICKEMNLIVMEYEKGLYACAGEGNRVFGFTNDEMKKEMGVRLHRELFLCYFIIYNIITRFYSDTGTSTFAEYVKAEDVIAAVDSALSSVLRDVAIVALHEVEQSSFKAIAIVWEDLPMMTSANAAEDISLRAGRSSKMGFVKMTFNFLVKQGLLLENEGRYYPKKRFRAMIENYFESYKGRLYEIMKGDM